MKNIIEYLAWLEFNRPTDPKITPLTPEQQAILLRGIRETGVKKSVAHLHEIGLESFLYFSRWLLAQSINPAEIDEDLLFDYLADLKIMASAMELIFNSDRINSMVEFKLQLAAESLKQ